MTCVIYGGHNTRLQPTTCHHTRSSIEDRDLGTVLTLSAFRPAPKQITSSLYPHSLSPRVLKRTLLQLASRSPADDVDG